MTALTPTVTAQATAVTASNKVRNFIERKVRSVSDEARDFLGDDQECFSRCQIFHGRRSGVPQISSGISWEEVRSTSNKVRSFIRGKVRSASNNVRDFKGRRSGVPQTRSDVS